jgi:hypothetical protein
LLEKLLTAPGLAAALAPGGLLVLESLSSAPLPENELWTAKDERTYGVTRVSFLAPVTRDP